MRVSHNMAVDLESCPCVGVTELALRHFRSCASVEKQSRVGMPKCVESAPRNIERAENRPEAILHDLVG